MQPFHGSVTTQFGTLTHTNGSINVSPTERSNMMKTTSGSVAFTLAEQQARNQAVNYAAQQTLMKGFKK